MRILFVTFFFVTALEHRSTNLISKADPTEAHGGGMREEDHMSEPVLGSFTQKGLEGGSDNENLKVDPSEEQRITTALVSQEKERKVPNDVACHAATIALVDPEFGRTNNAIISLLNTVAAAELSNRTLIIDPGVKWLSTYIFSAFDMRSAVEDFNCVRIGGHADALLISASTAFWRHDIDGGKLIWGKKKIGGWWETSIGDKSNGDHVDESHTRLFGILFSHVKDTYYNEVLATLGHVLSKPVAECRAAFPIETSKARSGIQSEFAYTVIHLRWLEGNCHHYFKIYRPGEIDFCDMQPEKVRAIMKEQNIAKQPLFIIGDDSSHTRELAERIATELSNVTTKIHNLVNQKVSILHDMLLGIFSSTFVGLPVSTFAHNIAIVRVARGNDGRSNILSFGHK